MFGCDAFILNDKKDFGKMDVRANPRTFSGYDVNSKSYRILGWDNNQVEKSRNVISDEFSMSKGNQNQEKWDAKTRKLSLFFKPA